MRDMMKMKWRKRVTGVRMDQKRGVRYSDYYCWMSLLVIQARKNKNNTGDEWKKRWYAVRWYANWPLDSLYTLLFKLNRLSFITWVITAVTCSRATLELNRRKEERKGVMSGISYGCHFINVPIKVKRDEEETKRLTYLWLIWRVAILLSSSLAWNNLPFYHCELSVFQLVPTSQPNRIFVQQCSRDSIYIKKYISIYKEG